MDETGIAALIGAWGPAGVIVAALAIAYYRKDRECKQESREIQEKRVEDAKEVARTVLTIADRQNQVAADISRALEQNTHALEELRETVRDLDRRKHGGG